MWVVGLLLGAIWGGATARSRQGNRLDIAQYAAVGAVAGGLVALVLTILIDRLV